MNSHKDNLFAVFLNVLPALFFSQLAKANEKTQISFQSNVKHILAQDSQWKAQKADIEAKIEASAQLKGSVLPQVSAAIKSQSEDAGTETSKANLVNARVEMNIFAFGRDSARWDQYSMLAEQLSKDLMVSKLSAEDRAERLLFESFQSFDKLQLTRKMILAHRKLTAVAKIQYEKGLLSHQDKEKVELDLEALHLQEKTDSLKHEQFLEALKIRSEDIDTTSSWPWPEGLNETFLTWVRAFNEDSFTKAISRHPRVLSAKQEVEVQNAKGRETRTYQYPTLDFSSEYEQRLGSTNGHRLIHSLEIRIPILDSLRSSSDYRAQVEEKYAAEMRLDDLQRNMRIELQENGKRLLLDGEGLRTRIGLVEKASRIYQTSVKKFEGGLLSVNELALDENRLFAFEREKAESMAQLHNSVLRFCQGLAWELEECSQRISYKNFE